MVCTGTPHLCAGRYEHTRGLTPSRAGSKALTGLLQHNSGEFLLPFWETWQQG